MLATSLTFVPKMTPVKMVVCVDTRNSLTDESFGCWGLSISRSLAVTLLSLLHAGADIRLVTMTPEGPAPLALGVGDTIEAVAARLEALPRSTQVIDPSKLLTWVRQSHGKVDLVLLATHSTNPVEDRVSVYNSICVVILYKLTISTSDRALGPDGAISSGPEQREVRVLGPALQEGAPRDQEPGEPQHAGHRRFLIRCQEDPAGIRKRLFLEKSYFYQCKNMHFNLVIS